MRRARLSKAALLWPLVLLLTGMAAAVWAGRWQAQRNEALQHERFQALAQQAAAQLLKRISIYEYAVRGVRGAVMAAGVDALTREGFHQYALSRDMQREFPGVRNFGFVRRVPAQQEAAFLEAVRLDGAPEFQIRPFGAHGGDRFVVQYIEPPLDGVASAQGVDLASEPRRREAALAAALSGEPRITGWNAAAERLLGWPAREVMGRRLSELTVPLEHRHAVRWMLQEVQQNKAVPPVQTLRLDRQGNRLEVAMSMVPMHAGNGLVVGAATTLRDIRAERAAQARILELSATLEQQVRQRTLLERAASAIIATDLSSRITVFNPAAEAMILRAVVRRRGTTNLLTSSNYGPVELPLRKLLARLNWWR